MPMSKIFFTQEMEEFLRKNVNEKSYKKLTIDFMNKYNIRISEKTIYNICSKLGIKKEYERTFLTNEQVEFLKINFKQLGYKELTERFNRKFNERKKITQIRKACKKHKLQKRKLVYTDEQIEFIKNMYKGISHEELTRLFNNKYGTKRTVKQIKNVCHVRNFLNNRNIRYTEEEIQWLQDTVPGKRWSEVTTLFNEKFSRKKTKNQIMIFCCSKGIHNGIPFGPSDANDGSIYIKDSRYSLIKVDGRWESMGRHEWQKHFGTLHNGYIVIYADGNCKNFSKDNLLAVTRAELITLNRKNLLFSVPEHTKTGVLIAKLLLKIKERQKEIAHGERGEKAVPCGSN